MYYIYAVHYGLLSVITHSFGCKNVKILSFIFWFLNAQITIKNMFTVIFFQITF